MHIRNIVNVSQKFEHLKERLQAKKSGDEWKAFCPNHNGKSQSLNFRIKNGRLVMICRGGCSTADVLAALGLDWKDLFEDTAKATRNQKEVDWYPYVDEQGALLFESVRLAAPKDFYQRQPNGRGGWIDHIRGVRRVLYHLPALQNATNVFIVEGERDVHTAEQLGLVATCNPMGAGKWRKEFSETLRAKHCVIIADADAPGREHAQQVAVSLHLIAASVKVIQMPGDAKDLSDAVEKLRGTFDAKALQTLAADAPIFNPDVPTPDAPKRILGSFSTRELFEQREIRADWLAWPFASIGLSCILDGLPKIGKTVLLLAAIQPARHGRAFLGYPTKPVRCVYVSEQSAASLGMQMQEMGFSGDEPIEELRFVTRENWSRETFPDLLEMVESQFLVGHDYNFLVLDTWHSISRLENENDAAMVNEAGNATLNVATRNKLALTMSRHDRKSGGDVGVSGRSSIQLSGLVDTIAHLVKIPDGDTRRKLELLSRVPGLPAAQSIELMSNGEYFNWGIPPVSTVLDRAKQVLQWLRENSKLTGEQIVEIFAAQHPPVKVSVTTANRYKLDALTSMHKP
jgi:5S rRNA maturation endonuclease (ribonuclease M5)